MTCRPVNVLFRNLRDSYCLQYTPAERRLTYEDIYTFLKAHDPKLEVLEHKPRFRIDGTDLRPDGDGYLLEDRCDFVQLELLPRLLGGKGGFGTLLRGKGARGPKTSTLR